MGNFEITIKWGDSLSKIAKDYGTTVKALQEANNIKNANKIIAGKTLIIPDGKGTTVEHTQATVNDEVTRKARQDAHQKEIAEINSRKNTPKEIETKPMKEVTVTEKAPKKETSKVAPGTNKTNVSIVKTISLVNDEMGRKGVPIEGGKKFGKNFGSAEYWANLIDKVSSEFDFPKEILIAKVSKEVTFQKNKIAGDQHGCLQIRNTAVRAMFPGAPGNWHEKYKELDEKLLNDILYKKDDHGKFLKDANGKMIPKYSKWQDLLKDCNNDEISLKVGALYDKMQMAEALTAEKYGSRGIYKNLSKTITELKEKTNISPKENLNNIRKMETRYNGSSSYGKAITDSIVRMGMDLSEPIIRKT